MNFLSKSGQKFTKFNVYMKNSKNLLNLMFLCSKKSVSSKIFTKSRFFTKFMFTKSRFDCTFNDKMVADSLHSSTALLFFTFLVTDVLRYASFIHTRGQ